MTTKLAAAGLAAALGGALALIPGCAHAEDLQELRERRQQLQREAEKLGERIQETERAEQDYWQLVREVFGGKEPPYNLKAQPEGEPSLVFQRLKDDGRPSGDPERMRLTRDGPVSGPPHESGD